MITENDVGEILQEELSEISTRLENLPSKGNIYKTMQCFVDFTIAVAGNNNLVAVKVSFGLAEKMLTDGNKVVKNDVENVFVYSMGTSMEMVPPLQEKAMDLFPENLKRVYHTQIIANYP